MPTLSLLMPTRDRIDLVTRFFQSILDTAEHIEDLEIILAVDDDDQLSQQIENPHLNVRKVILPRGSSMGMLNQAAFEASTGRYIALVNDDIIIRTPSWDTHIRKIFADFSDDIALIHVNDMLFKERLCTFPILSRRACLEVGLCPPEYRRYRIDDHIYDIYNMLGYLGHRRIVYVPEIVFEHDNFSATSNGNEHGTFYQASADRFYVPNPEILKEDAATYDRLFGSRKEVVTRLSKLIDQGREAVLKERHSASEASLSHADPEKKLKVFDDLLAQLKDSYTYRRGDLITRVSLSSRPPTGLPRTTIGIVTADIQSEHAKRCISLVKQNTTNYDIVILDNGRHRAFRHAWEMNRILRMTESDFLVLMDDDIFVESGWLEGLFQCMDEKTGVVAPAHVDDKGWLNFTGAYLSGDGVGTHEHLKDVPTGPRATQVCCSALLLIDLKKCGHIFMDEVYLKYFFDVAYSLRVWEAGYRVVVNPDVIVTHLGGATMVRGTQEAKGLWERDQRVFTTNWIHTGRLAAIEDGIWQREPEIAHLLSLSRRIMRLTDAAKTMSLSAFKNEVARTLLAIQYYDAFATLMVYRFTEVTRYFQNIGSDEGNRFSMGILLRLQETLNQSMRQEQLANLSDSLHNKDKTQSALDVLEEALKLDPFAPTVLARVAMNLYKLGDCQGAEQNFSRALLKAPRDPFILHNLGSICFELKNFEAARHYLRLAVDLKPDNLEAWARLEIIGQNLNDDDLSRTASQHIRALSSNH